MPPLPPRQKRHLIKVAQAELKAWKNLPPALVIAILFAFIHRASTGKTIEETFFRTTKQPPIDYEI